MTAPARPRKASVESLATLAPHVEGFGNGLIPAGSSVAFRWVSPGRRHGMPTPASLARKGWRPVRRHPRWSGQRDCRLCAECRESRE